LAKGFPGAKIFNFGKRVLRPKVFFVFLFLFLFVRKNIFLKNGQFYPVLPKLLESCDSDHVRWNPAGGDIGVRGQKEDEKT
jgi:hypothetical protein